MERTILWKTLQEPGLEHLVLHETPDGITADGFVIGVFDSQPFRLHYLAECDPFYYVRKATLTVAPPHSRQITLRSDGSGNWRDASGAELVQFRGCIDIDITASPFTNILPIRRLQWIPGKSAEIAVVYIIIPELELKIDRQRYTCLEMNDDTRLYRFERLDGGFSANVRVDADGLVTDYADIFQRVSL